MAEGLKIEMQLHGLEGVYQTLLSLPKEVVSKKGGPVKTALRKGALVILKAEKAALQSSLSNNPRYSTGQLLKSLIATRGKPPAGTNGERYLVRVKRKLYSSTPDGRSRKGKSITSTVANAQRMEYGTSTQPAEPFIRPAFNAKAADAIRTVETELVREVDKIAAKLLQQNKGR